MASELNASVSDRRRTFEAARTHRRAAFIGLLAEAKTLAGAAT
jgi:hypothetical protein